MDGESSSGAEGDATYLVHGDADKQAARDGLVAVDGVGAGNARQRRDLDAGARVADDDNGLPGPAVLVADGHDDVAQDHDQDVGDLRE